jgi:hypothetical protein
VPHPDQIQRARQPHRHFHCLYCYVCAEPSDLRGCAAAIDHNLRHRPPAFICTQGATLHPYASWALPPRRLYRRCAYSATSLARTSACGLQSQLSSSLRTLSGRRKSASTMTLPAAGVDANQLDPRQQNPNAVKVITAGGDGQAIMPWLIFTAFLCKRATLPRHFQHRSLQEQAFTGRDTDSSPYPVQTSTHVLGIPCRSSARSAPVHGLKAVSPCLISPTSGRNSTTPICSRGPQSLMQDASMTKSMKQMCVCRGE